MRSLRELRVWPVYFQMGIVSCFQQVSARGARVSESASQRVFLGMWLDLLRIPAQVERWMAEKVGDGVRECIQPNAGSIKEVDNN